MKALEIITMIMIVIVCTIILFKTLNLRNPFRKRLHQRLIDQGDLHETESHFHTLINLSESRLKKRIKTLQKQVKILKNELHKLHSISTKS
jgi:ABC-type phosphate transport system auxiliary subunit